MYAVLISAKKATMFTNLVDIKFLYDIIECSVEVIEKVDDLHRTALSWQCSEAADVREIDSHLIKPLGSDILTLYEKVDHDDVQWHGNKESGKLVMRYCLFGWKRDNSIFV